MGQWRGGELTKQPLRKAIEATAADIVLTHAMLRSCAVPGEPLYTCSPPRVHLLSPPAHTYYRPPRHTLDSSTSNFAARHCALRVAITGDDGRLRPV